MGRGKEGQRDARRKETKKDKAENEEKKGVFVKDVSKDWFNIAKIKSPGSEDTGFSL